MLENGMGGAFLVLDARGEELLVTSWIGKDGDGMDREQEHLVDQLDLDGTGADVLVTVTDLYENWLYSVYRLVDGRWKRVYRGGRFMC